MSGRTIIDYAFGDIVVREWREDQRQRFVASNPSGSLVSQAALFRLIRDDGVAVYETMYPAHMSWEMSDDGPRIVHPVIIPLSVPSKKARRGSRKHTTRPLAFWRRIAPQIIQPPHSEESVRIINKETTS